MTIKVTPDTQSLKLQVSQDKVWYLNGDLGYPKCAGVPITEYLDNPPGPVITSDTHVRVVGNAANVRMIMHLYDLKQKGKLGKVEVCTPLVCCVAKHRQDPQAVLMAMRQFNRAASLGGFHEVSELDYRSYALSNALYQGNKQGQPVSIDAMSMLRQHPVWRPLSFIKSLNKVAVAGLLSYILDPRWYVNACSPDSMGKMFEWLGLTPRTQAGISGNRSPGRHHRRCHVVLRCWKDPALEPDIRNRFEVALPQPVEGCDLAGCDPSDFVWRVWGARLKLGIPDAGPGDPVMADLRASQRFVMFLRLTWLSELYRDSGAMPDHGAPLFRPTDFFKHALETAAYERHQVRNKMI